MSRRTNSPAYLKIALDIASRIVNGDFIEGKKLSGRSTLVGIYNVSPETIRRSIALLQDMDVVVVEEKSGITIKSKTNAGSFIEKFKTKNEFATIKHDIYSLIEEKKELESKLENKINDLIEFATQLRNVGLIVPYESLVEPNSLIIGKTLGELNFWNNTGATIIGVKREGKLYLSPGPYLAIKNGDIIVYVGESEVIENVNNYITSQVK
ncbi:MULTISPECIES: TrkA C-terminal domain-containing protein [Clostridium]|uniref:TrkA C-terminal domain-containing protein n=1 Tax=Clostridium TaxID=1485 RepID=UPI000C087C24|nr:MULTISPECIES: TrkA C-terminal domain-containing protein [Clostridium]MBS7131640.1 GntR family transcriptional regulator [Clostridium sp.]MDB2075023.1 GntR family transcriptional regulator [Clostridium paraputrificum]MDB2078195.1 GntR family transcriptional regulator [Clostridium paraputrificum]MDB2091650.1 GntR family transcriptional regulator [Clostridium paraputrificum]MDB2098615.1 GntR family transcriptional regulator [Clostridium paraputrificum]